MAEGGGDDSDNPFSFKKFVKKKDRSSSFSDEDKDKDDTEDIFALPDVSAPRRKGKAALIVEDEPQPVPTKKNPDENPFSFKKFLSGGSSQSRGGGSPRSRNNAPDFANDLPDFVQDHLLDENQIKKERDFDLPDFALTSNPDQGNVSHDNQYDNSDLPDVGNNEHDHQEDGHNSLEDAVPNTTSNRSSMPSSLPDFLSDGAINNSEMYNGATDGDMSADNSCSLSQRRDVSSLEVHGDLELENRRLRDENQKLKKMVEDTKRLAVKESERVSELLKRMERQQKKEADETAVMERAVQQVEANLVTTTQRAVKAENTVAKLKQEVKTLQNRISALQADKQTQGPEDPLAAIKERTKYSSEQLAAAADTGEQTIKQLLSGVDKLRLLSQVLASIDRMTEVNEDSNTEATSSGSNT